MKRFILAVIMTVFVLCVAARDFSPAHDEKKKEAKLNLPAKLPFELARDGDTGEALTLQEIKDFTVKLTGYWKKADFFKWWYRASHGVDKSTGLPDYSILWHDVEAIKKGDVVTFHHTGSGGAHNAMIPTNEVLAQAAAGYLLTGDKDMAKIVEQFSKGVTAMFKGMLWDKNDTEKYIMARNIVTKNFSYTLDGGRKAAVDYSGWYVTSDDAWNTHQIHFPNNPYWGDIYIHNMRSKDDVPHIYRAAGFLAYVVAYGKDKNVVAAAKEAYEYLQGFAKDIVDSGYHIRTKGNDGKAYIPKEDLASFVDYENIAPTAECNAKLISALLGYGDTRGLDCQYGSGGMYEKAAAASHYFNYKIFHGFHMSAVLHALIHGQNDAAKKLLTGLADRADKLTTGKGHKQATKDPSWNRDLAVFLLQSASVGLPLTSQQARIIVTEYAKAVDAYKDFPRYDLWDKSVPDGTYGSNGGYLPDDHGIVRPEEIGFVLEYCYSPFKNPSGKIPVDCEIVKNMAKWGKE